MARICIVGPCYKVAPYLDAYVESILAQTFRDWEMVLVDDGSPDESGAIIDRWAAKDPRIRAVHKVNGGLSDARNAGWQAASPEAEHLFFPDPDDILEPTALAELARELENHPEAGAVLCHQSLIDSEGNPMPGGRRERWAKKFGLPWKLRDSDPTIPFLTFFCGSAAGPYVMWQRRTLEAAGPWDTRLAPWEDSDMFCRVALLSEIRFLPRPLYRYRNHDTQATTNGEKMRRFYGLFRAKWEQMPATSPDQADQLAEARTFYWKIFRPCRNLGTAAKAMKQFVKRPSGKGAWWIRFLLTSALKQFCGQRDPLPVWPPGNSASQEPAP
jgi:glycosyltransferase involved in cell wall biosynthesis